MRQIMRLCKRCGEPFPQRGHAYLCEACSLLAKRDSVLRDRTCKQCGKTFLGGPRAWYCPECRADRKREQDAAYRQTGTARPMGSTDLCVKCGKPYVVNGSRQKYCPACAKDATKEAVKPHKREYAQAVKDMVRLHRSKMRERSALCIICGAPIISRGNKLTCSDACDQIRRSQNQATADVKRGRRKSAEPRVRTAPQSGIPGITWHSRSGKWQVTYRNKYIGLYDNMEDAKDALSAAKSIDPPAP